jgi:hypothetical protein
VKAIVLDEGRAPDVLESNDLISFIDRRKTMTTKDGMNTYRTTAIVVGVLYLAGLS